LIRPNLTKKQIDQGTQINIRTLVLNWAELLGDKRSDPKEVRKKVSGIEELLAQYRAGGQIIVAFPHIGPIHGLMSAIAAFELKVFVPVEAIPLPLYKLMARQRSKYADIQFAPVRKGQVLEGCLEKLAEGRIVILAMDILTESGVPCRIGDKAVGCFPVGAVRLALKSGATLFPVFPSWGRDGKARLLVGSPFELVRSGDLERDTVSNVRGLVRLYEPFLVENCFDWWRLPWSKLEPVGEENKTEDI
jgi:lauroyl/myristoyl acyltransferase